MNMATYETFAAVYDAVMDDSLYDLWTDFSLRHLPKSKVLTKVYGSDSAKYYRLIHLEGNYTG